MWDNDPRVAWVQTGLIGYWGEQENPVGINQDGWAQRLGPAFTAAFRNKKLIVRNLNHWPGFELGVYSDSFGHPSQSSVGNTIRSFNLQGRYLTQVVEGEVAYDWGTDTFDPRYGGEPEITLNSAQLPVVFSTAPKNKQTRAGARNSSHILRPAGASVAYAHVVPRFLTTNVEYLIPFSPRVCYYSAQTTPQVFGPTS